MRIRWLMTLSTKSKGEWSAGEPPAQFDVAGAGTGLMVELVSHSRRKRIRRPLYEPHIDRPTLRPLVPDAGLRYIDGTNDEMSI